MVLVINLFQKQYNMGQRNLLQLKSWCVVSKGKSHSKEIADFIQGLVGPVNFGGNGSAGVHYGYDERTQDYEVRLHCFGKLITLEELEYLVTDEVVAPIVVIPPVLLRQGYAEMTDAQREYAEIHVNFALGEVKREIFVDFYNNKCCTKWKEILLKEFPWLSDVQTIWNTDTSNPQKSGAVSAVARLLFNNPSAFQLNVAYDDPSCYYQSFLIGKELKPQLVKTPDNNFVLKFAK
jgi:hypothetical protein